MKEFKNGYWFDYETADGCLDDVMKVKGVDDMTITMEAVNEINSILGTDAMDDEMDIRAVRNAVVDRLSDRINDSSSFDNWRKCSMWMSAITAAIDHTLYDKGFVV